MDASVWISAMLPLDTNNRSSATWLDMANGVGMQFAVPAHFPAEVTGVLRRIDPEGKAIDLIIETVFDPGFFAVHDLTRELARFSAEVAGRATLRGADAVYVALAAWLDLPLLTWDVQQRQRGELFCRAMTPVEAMPLLR